MSNTPRQPRPDDAVLGGQFQAPIDGAVLGGIEGLRQRLIIDNFEVKKVALTQALNYGEKGVEVLFEILEKEKKLDIYWYAYQLLESSSKKNLSWWDKLQGKTGDDSFSGSLKQHIRKQLKKYFPCYEFESVTVNRRGEIIQRNLGKVKYFREDLSKGIYLDMTYIPGGTFLMGALESDKHNPILFGNLETSRPEHQVTFPPFWMGKYTVTQEQWQAIMGNNPSYFKGAKRPVEKVSWKDCQKFCQKLSQRTEKAYSLPSEAQWEYACRAGTTTPFHYGETITSDLANYSPYSDYTYAEESEGVRRRETVAVGSFPANDFGLYDMHGNVWEWCGDHWHKSYDDKPENIKNNGNIIWANGDDGRLVLRGGSWASGVGFCRSAYRAGEFSYLRDDHDSCGFRLVLPIA